MRDHDVGARRTARIGPWRDSSDIATVATYIDQPLDAAAVRACMVHLTEAGYRQVITAALEPREQQAFIDNGFSPLRSLTLLRHDLTGSLARPQHRLRRLRTRQADDVLAVDHAAFEDFWRFDSTALHEAIRATPQRLLRATSDRPLTGYALTGLARDRGYLQRLAVDPAVHGRGIGTALLVDALRWLRVRGATTAYVNTQSDNDRAMALYLHHGFTLVPGGLAMLQVELQ